MPYKICQQNWHPHMLLCILNKRIHKWEISKTMKTNNGYRSNMQCSLFKKKRKQQSCTMQTWSEWQVMGKNNNHYTYSAGHSIRNNSNCLVAWRQSVQRSQEEKWTSLLKNQTSNCNWWWPNEYVTSNGTENTQIHEAWWKWWKAIPVWDK